MVFYRSVKKLIGENGKRLIPSIVLSFCDSFLYSCMYVVMFLVLISLVEESFTAEMLIKYSAFMLGIVLLRMVVQSIGFTNAQCTGADISYQLRTTLGNHIRELGLGFFNKNSIGKLNGVLLTDVADFEAIITHCLCDVVKTISFLIIVSVFSFCVNIWYGILVLVILVISFPMLLRSGKVSESQAVSRKNASNQASARIVEYITGMKTFRLYHMIGGKFEKLEEALRKLKNESVKSELRLIPLAMGFSAVNGMLIPASLILGTWLYDTRAVNMSAFVIMILMSISISSTMTLASALYPQLCSISKSTEHITEILDTPSMEYTTKQYSVEKGEICFRKVAFGYDETKVLDDITFTAKAGTVTALVGPSGSGKTTIVSLLARFWDVNDGAITLDGTDIRNIKPDVLTANMAIVFQDVYLFADTIYNNIRIGNLQATKEEIIEAAKAAQCHEFIMQMDKGYETMIGEGGSTLSGGEKQRIAIARALVRNTPIVLLDETTSSLDVDNEKEINLAFEHLMKNRTVLVIAHRLNTIRRADQILVLKQGRIEEQGNHESLMQHENSWYKNMVNEQEKAQNWYIHNRGKENMLL